MNDLDKIFDELYQELECTNKENKEDEFVVKLSIPEKYGLFTEDCLIENTKIKNLSVSIYIYSNEGKNFPHCHIIEISENNKKQFHCCVCLHEAKYFIHKGKEDTFNSKQRKVFNKLMKSKVKGTKNKTVWEYLVDVWNKNNDYKLKIETMPNYRNLDGCIRERK